MFMLYAVYSQLSFSQHGIIYIHSPWVWYIESKAPVVLVVVVYALDSAVYIE